MRAREAEQVEPGEHAADDVVAGRGGADAGADGRCDAFVEPSGTRLEGVAGQLRRALGRGEAGGSRRRVGQATIELGELRRGHAGAGRRRDAQLDRGRGGVPRAQVDRRRPVAARADPRGRIGH